MMIRTLEKRVADIESKTRTSPKLDSARIVELTLARLSDADLNVLQESSYLFRSGLTREEVLERLPAYEGTEKRFYATVREVVEDNIL